METNAFAPLGVLQIPYPARLLTSACCIDKDLVALISRLGGQDRLSLWNYTHGYKVWEVGVGGADETIAEIIGLAWSPDGQSVAVVHHPPRITLHSLQDGTKQITLPVSQPSGTQPCHLVGVWWFRDERSTRSKSIPDIFKRNDIITGTSHAILQTLPLLDCLQEDSQKLTATDLFAFQGSQIKPTSKSVYPEVIEQWPTLSVDPFSASIGASSIGKSVDQPGRLDDVDDTNVNSILAVTDDLGYLHCFLDGSFPLGAIFLGPELSIRSLSKHPKLPMFLVHPGITANQSTGIVTSLPPIIVDIPLLEKRHPRDLAKLSSTARELTWYTMRVVKEMHTIWFGSDAVGGAKELGPKWVTGLEDFQEDFGQEPNAMFDLTTLLVTGRLTDCMSDFMGSGEQMSERGIQKWESTMTEALVKLRDYSEKRVAPACQRLHLVLEELRGWSQLPQYGLFELSATAIDLCLELASKIIILAAWLADTARRDLSRFREFIVWLRFETSAANPTSDNTQQPRHDILEVNNYFVSGLVTNAIDKWFTGPIPQFSVRDLGVPEGDDPVLAVLQKARVVANDPIQMAWRTNMKKVDLDHVDRNIDALVQELATRCRSIFDGAAGAACRSAVATSSQDFAKAVSCRVVAQSARLVTRERTTTLDESREFLQYLAIPLSSEEPVFLCIARLRFNIEASESPLEVAVSLLERGLPVGEEESLVDLDLLEADFFDDECVVIACRLRDQPKSTCIATLNYSDLDYQVLQTDGYVKIPTREDLMLETIAQWKKGNLKSVRSPIKRSRVLGGCKTGEVSLALNGRLGRRVACVLDSKGIILESFDMEGGIDDIDSDEETS